MTLAAYAIFLSWQLVILVSSFNIDTKNPIIKTGSQNSRFGFSIVGHTLSITQRGVFVGAPKSGKNGEVYYCPADGSNCQHIPVDVPRLARTNDEFSDALFGYSLATINESIPEKLTICAPRITRSSVSLVYITGGCFEVDADFKNPTFILPSMSICQEIPESEKKIDLRHCTTGASVGRHPSAPDELYMGGPYFYYAKGVGAMVDMRKFTKVHTTVDGLLANTLLGSSMDLSDRIYNPSHGSYRSVHVAFGGPGVPVTSMDDENTGTGMVLIYTAFSTEYDASIRPVLRLNGKRFGSRFGHSLIFVDVNGDGWDDLVVGAPYQQLEAVAGSMREYGAVFVFINQQSVFPYPVHDLEGISPFSYQPESAYQILTPSDIQNDCGSSPLSGYGSTLAKIGDINHDGYQDFAVGAPYGERGGVVFIYHGSKSGRISLPTQVICTTKLPVRQSLDGLGFSVGLRGLDLDGNGYADVAIGAPLSDSLVVLRTRPVVRLHAHITMSDGSAVIPENLEALSDCTRDAATLSGYKAIVVRCLDLKLFMTYTSVDGYPCSEDKRYKISALLKADPVSGWLDELGIKPDEETNQPQINPCGQRSSTVLNSEIFDIYRQLSVAPVSFIGEKSIQDFGSNVDKYFPSNKSASLAGLDSPGGYLSVDVQATCREDASSVEQNGPTASELSGATNLRLVFRDTKIIDRTRPISIGVRWVATFPEPTSGFSDINLFPISDPRENSQLVKLKIDNQCDYKPCCPTIRTEFFIDVTRDKNGPVVFVGDDKTQTISVRVRVSNIGGDPVYGLNLVATYPSNLLELTTSEQFGRMISQDAAICHLANPLAAGQTTECTIKWLVIGHQLTVQMAKFSVNSTVNTGGGVPITVEGSLRNELKVNIKMVANVSVEGAVEPSTVYFSGNVSDGISSITAENQIGDSRFLIKFTVRNLLRHSLIPVSRLIIDWPYEIAGDIKEPHGKYLLYLLETPSVIRQQLSPPHPYGTNTSSVTCDSRVLKKLVNPHGYRVFPFLKPAAESVPVLLAPVDMPSSHPSTYPALAQAMDVEDVPSRLDYSKKSGKRKMTSISCYNGQLRCIPIVCDLGKLSYKAGPITLEFIARLWDNTMRQDFKDIFLTKLQMTATWRADVKYAIDLGDSDHAQEMIEISIFNNLEPKPVVPKYMALYIGLAVFGGVLLLAILIIILKKAGFFKRKRFVLRPRRVSKDATNAAERVHLTSQPEKSEAEAYIPYSAHMRHRSKPKPGLTSTDHYPSKSRSKDQSGFQPLQPDSSQRGTYRAMR